MKTEQRAFAERLRAALDAAGIEPSAAALEKLVPRHGGDNVTPQAISGWLSGKHVPKRVNMRALARIVGQEPHLLEHGGRSAGGVRDMQTAWPEHVRGHDRLAFEEFLTLPEASRKLVREIIAALADTTRRKRPG